MKIPAILTAVILSVLPQVHAAEALQKIDVSKLPQQSKMVDDVVVPIPSEIFSVLDKLGKPNWPATQHPLKGVAQPFGDQSQNAFYLGTIIAEGFIAVESQDAAEVTNVGQSVLKLGTVLGVREAVVKHANAVINAANKSNWGEVKTELDRALNEVKNALTLLKSEDQATMISLGGWVRGTEALCDVVGGNFSKDGADLLHQPALLAHFSSKLSAMKPKARKNALVIKAQAALTALTPLIGGAQGADISEKSVKETRNIAADFVKAIQTK